MVCAVPVVKVVEDAVRLVDGDDGAFGEGVQFDIGDEGGDFEDVVVLAVEPGHFEVDPDEVVGVLHERSCAFLAAQHCTRCRPLLRYSRFK